MPLDTIMLMAPANLARENILADLLVRKKEDANELKLLRTDGILARSAVAAETTSITHSMTRITVPIMYAYSTLAPTISLTLLLN